jgi:hypothetical protein
MAEDFPPPPQLPNLEMVEDPDAPQGGNQEGWQVDADQDEAAGYKGVDGDMYIVRGNGNRVLDAGQLDPNNGEQVGGDQKVLAEHHRRIREAARGRRMAVIRENCQEEIKAPRVEPLRDRVPFSARGTLPHRELPRF